MKYNNFLKQLATKGEIEVKYIDEDFDVATEIIIGFRSVLINNENKFCFVTKRNERIYPLPIFYIINSDDDLELFEKILYYIKYIKELYRLSNFMEKNIFFHKYIKEINCDIPKVKEELYKYLNKYFDNNNDLVERCYEQIFFG